MREWAATTITTTKTLSKPLTPRPPELAAGLFLTKQIQRQEQPPLHDMLQPIPVILAAHNPEWHRTAATHAQRLQVLGPNLVAVHHIGSTSVPGLIAKPIIDLMPVVTSLTSLDEQRQSIEALGYTWHGEYGISGRRYCTLTDEAGARAAQLHFFNTDSPHVERHIAFRDYLRAHPEEANAYAIEKRRAQSLHPTNSHAYADEKDKWIRAAETKALIWVSRQKQNYGIT